MNTISILLPNGEAPKIAIPDRLNFALIEKLSKGELELHHARRGKVNHELADLTPVLERIKKGWCDFPRESQQGGNPALSLFWRYMTLLDFPIVHVENGEWTNIYCQFCSWLHTEEQMVDLVELLKTEISHVAMHPRIKQTISYRSKPKSLKWRAYRVVDVLSEHSGADQYKEFKQIIE